jgi:hypothetical protein
MLLTSEAVQRKLEAHQQELEAQTDGIGQLLQDQQGLHDKLLKQFHQLSEIQEVLAACAASLARVPRSPTLTLQASLEVAARLGPGFCLSSGSKVWTARELLALFQQMQPLSLQMRVSLVKPGITSAGAIYEVGAGGEVITDAPLFRIEQPRSGGPPQKKRKRKSS